MRYLIIGNPENRRVTLFQQALARQGEAAARVVAYGDLLSRGPEEALLALPDQPTLLRIDSAGEDFEVERGLLGLGYEEALQAGVSTVGPDELATLRPDRGRILCPRQLHLGFLRLLHRLKAVLQRRPAWRPLATIETIAELFDKRATSARYAAAQIPVPGALFGEDGGAITCPDQLREVMREHEISSAFVKLSCASSASCLAVYYPGRSRGSEFLMTTTEMTPSAWYNSLRLRRISHRARIDELLTFLLREGSQIERQVPKARLAGAFFDCRVLAVAGEPAFTVVRQSRHPITNLHLGGWRGDLAQLRRELPGETWQRALRTCRKVAGLHRTHQLGIDLMFEPGLRGLRVLEANAFGDLLPGLTREGMDVYEWQIHRARERRGC